MRDITPFAGLLPIVKLWNQLQLPQIIDTSTGIRNIQQGRSSKNWPFWPSTGIRKHKGYTDSDQLLSLVLLNLSGGSAVEPLKFLKEQLGMESFPLAFPSPTSACIGMGLRRLFS